MQSQNVRSRLHPANDDCDLLCTAPDPGQGDFPKPAQGLIVSDSLCTVPQTFQKSAQGLIAEREEAGDFLESPSARAVSNGYP